MQTRFDQGTEHVDPLMRGFVLRPEHIDPLFFLGLLVIIITNKENRIWQENLKK